MPPDKFENYTFMNAIIHFQGILDLKGRIPLKAQFCETPLATAPHHQKFKMILLKLLKYTGEAVMSFLRCIDSSVVVKYI